MNITTLLECILKRNTDIFLWILEYLMMGMSNEHFWYDVSLPREQVPETVLIIIFKAGIKIWDIKET